MNQTNPQSSHQGWQQESHQLARSILGLPASEALGKVRSLQRRLEQRLTRLAMTAAESDEDDGVGEELMELMTIERTVARMAEAARRRLISLN